MSYKTPLEFNTVDFHATIKKQIKIALVTDLHDLSFRKTSASFKSEQPDLICISGDLISWHKIRKTDMNLKRYINIKMKREIRYEDCGHLYSSLYALDFLKFCAGIAPTYYSLGNHERFFDERDRACVQNTGAVLVDNSYVQQGEIAIGGLTSAYVSNMDHFQSKNTGMTVSISPASKVLAGESLNWLKDFEKCSEFKVLLCHHPEYYDLYLKHRNIDLILAGHAHGGQVRIGKRGLFAPGQGLFPHYVSGLYDDKLLVSRGIANVSKYIPRINNTREVIYVNLIPV